MDINNNFRKYNLEEVYNMLRYIENLYPFDSHVVINDKQTDVVVKYDKQSMTITGMGPDYPPLIKIVYSDDGYNDYILLISWDNDELIEIKKNNDFLVFLNLDLRYIMKEEYIEEITSNPENGDLNFNVLLNPINIWTLNDRIIDFDSDIPNSVHMNIITKNNLISCVTIIVNYAYTKLNIKMDYVYDLDKVPMKNETDAIDESKKPSLYNSATLINSIIILSSLFIILITLQITLNYLSQLNPILNYSFLMFLVILIITILPRRLKSLFL